MNAPGRCLFLVCDDYPDGGYPVVFIEKDTWRENGSIVSYRANEVSARNQAVPDDVLRDMTRDERCKFKGDLDFILDKWKLSLLRQKEKSEFEIDFDDARVRLAKAYNRFVAENDPEKRRDILKRIGFFIGCFLAMNSDSEGYRDLSDEIEINFDF